MDQTKSLGDGNQRDFEVPKSTEGEMTKKIEAVTSKVPSMGYLGLALGSLALSAGIAVLTERKNLANFVGLWVPSFMLMGIYNKLVKLESSDHQTNPNLH